MRDLSHRNDPVGARALHGYSTADLEDVRAAGERVEAAVPFCCPTPVGLSAAQFYTVDVMIRDEGVEKLRGHHREAVFEAVATKANWPTVAGVRIGPDEDLLVAGGRVRAELKLLGLSLSVAGAVTTFEQGAFIEATGSQRGISATMAVRFTDNAHDANRNDPVETTVTWRFEAQLPKRQAVLELPAAAAIKAAIPLIRARFIANIIQHLDGRQPVVNEPSVAGTLDDRVPRPVNEGEPTQDDPLEGPSGT